MMRDDARLRIQSELGSKEHVLWSGRPKTGLMLRSSDIFLIPFSLMWGGFAIFWEIGVISSGGPFFFILWGIPFVLVAFYITIGRFFVDAYLRANTSYVLTNERVMILSGLINQNVKSLGLKSLTEINLSHKWNGMGTITFGPTQPMHWMYSDLWASGSGRNTPPSFEMINDAKGVYDRIREAQSQI